LKVTKAYSFFSTLTIIIVLTACSDKTKDIQEIEVGDIAQFGTSLVGKKVEYQARISRAYPCQLPVNLGNQCLEVYKQIGNDLQEEAVIIKDSAYSIEQYRDWMDNKKLVKFKGKVELRPGAGQDYKENTMSPVLVAEKIESIN
jgi:hypothetical protein